MRKLKIDARGWKSYTDGTYWYMCKYCRDWIPHTAKECPDCKAEVIFKGKPDE